MKINKANISGVITKNPELFFMTKEEYYMLEAKVKTNGRENIIPIVVPRRSIDPMADYRGCRIELKGYLQSKKVNHHLYVYIFANEANIFYSFDELEDVNEIEFTGSLKKKVLNFMPRKHKSHSDIFIQNFYYYYPCVCKSNDVDKIRAMELNTIVHCFGTFNSRTYTKDGETKTAYEVALNNIERLAD
jgi:hypothetical protein